jgi:hypothetical protein
MTPDFEYFIRMKVRSEYSHTLLGLFWFDLPLGLLLCFVYHNIVRNSLIDNLPKPLNRRLTFFKSLGWTKYFKTNWSVVLISILVGAYSHLLWDSFTHETGFFVTRLPILHNPIYFDNWSIPLYKCVQHLSTLIGGLFIIITLLRLEKHPVFVTTKFSKYWSSVTAISLTVLILRFTFGLSYYQYGNVIVTVISGGLLSLIVTPLILERE